MKGAILTGIIYLVGGLFLLIGLIGLVLPVLQGIIFLFIGLLILSNRSSRAKKLLVWLKSHLPRRFYSKHKTTEEDVYTYSYDRS